MSEEQVVQDELSDSLEANISQEIEIFVQHIDSLASSLPNVMLMATVEKMNAHKKFFNFAKKYGEIQSQNEESTSYYFKSPYHLNASRLKKKINQANVSGEILPRVFVLALVSQFDAFLGRLLRALFLLRPENIANSERNFTLSQLLELGSISNATEFLIEKEVESVLRLSHLEQFKWMENKFKIKLRKDLPSFPILIELTERRNLFAHSNGIVSDQYLAVCKKNGVQLPNDCKRGDSLDVTAEYFQCAYACVYEIAIKLSQVLWRKLKPEQIEVADLNLNDVGFNLILSGNYKLACNLFDFACTTLKKHANIETKYIMTLNRAQAYKWAKDSKKCEKIINDVDWSACGQRFHLAVAVLKDDFTEAATIMKRIGPNGEMAESEYQDWPIFKEFRETETFLKTYEEIFSKQFVHVEKIFNDEESEQDRKLIETLERMTA